MKFNLHDYQLKRNFKDIIEKRFNFLAFFIAFTFSIVLLFILYMQVLNVDYYKEEVENSNITLIYGDSAPRGRIYDRNNNLLVDNEAIKTIYYSKPSGVTTSEELEIASKLAEVLEVDYSGLTTDNLKEIWLILNDEAGDSLITEEEWENLDNRLITSDEIYDIKMERISLDKIDNFSDLEKEGFYIYFLMNKGYSFDDKVIKNVGVSDEEYGIIGSMINELDGVNTKLDWNRIYLYDDTFSTILGRVSSDTQGIPYELTDYYLSKGYSLNDRVGISYLEYQYEDILKGTKSIYQLSGSNYTLYEEGQRGNDIVLTIDIELQMEVEKIIEEEVIAAMGEANTEYYNRSFVIITDPDTGEVLAMSGKQGIRVEEEIDGEIVETIEIYDYTPGIITSPITAGSVVKAASMIIGYDNEAIEIGDGFYDTCIKIQNTPIKCSWTYLGYVDDVRALAMSSNTFQYNMAMIIGEGNYEYNQPLSLNEEAFDIYRNTYMEFGLGSYTGIDLPGESIGYKGSSTLPGHLLDFSIGQYDNYTPMQISQYINTVANNGTRLQPYLLKEVFDSSYNDLSSLIYKNGPTILNVIDTEEEYFDRVNSSLRETAIWGTAAGYMPQSINGASKTGTSQSFIDTDGDGIVDTETITNTFAGYAPYDDPVMSMVVISPDVKVANSDNSYKSPVNSRISYRVSQKFFDIYQ